MPQAPFITTFRGWGVWPWNCNVPTISSRSFRETTSARSCSQSLGPGAFNTMKTFSNRIATGGVLLFACALAASAQKGPKDLYLDKCSACHGPDGAGQTAKGKKLKMKGVKETAAKMSAPDMVKVVQNGK